VQHQPREGNARQPVSRVLSAPVVGRDDHSSGTHLAMRLTRPTRAAGLERPCNYHGILHRNITAAPIRSCSRWGLPCRPCCQGRGALLPHRFALARGARSAYANPPCTGGLFSVALSLGSPPPAVSRHRVPVEPGLSSIGGSARQQRPSGCLAGAVCARIGQRSSGQIKPLQNATSWTEP
jgi:hypothetical protein